MLAFETGSNIRSRSMKQTDMTLENAHMLKSADSTGFPLTFEVSTKGVGPQKGDEDLGGMMMGMMNRTKSLYSIASVVSSASSSEALYEENEAEYATHQAQFACDV